jgi:hypothetical protein
LPNVLGRGIRNRCRNVSNNVLNEGRKGGPNVTGKTRIMEHEKMIDLEGRLIELEEKARQIGGYALSIAMLGVKIGEQNQELFDLIAGIQKELSDSVKE